MHCPLDAIQPTHIRGICSKLMIAKLMIATIAWLRAQAQQVLGVEVECLGWA